LDYHSILWRRLDRPGHESARVIFQDSTWRLIGTAVFAHEQEPCLLDYLVICDSAWRTLTGRVTGWLGNEPVDIQLTVDAAHRWLLNGAERHEAEGCIDLDLNFSPSTNLFPIRRLDLAIGQESAVRAAWLRFPSFTLEPLEQIYRRVGERTYRYESAGGRFVAELAVNEAGFVINYPEFCEAEVST